jgi:hypothetical protein
MEVKKKLRYTRNNVSTGFKKLDILIFPKGEYIMGGYFRILAAIPGFFLSSLIFMLLWNANIDKFFPSQLVQDISYVKAMLATITLWLTVAPLAAVGKNYWHR